MATLLPRRVVGTLSAVLFAITGVVGLALPAHAEDGYQYWNYFHLHDGDWAFSEVGPADYKPKDGDVEGFRYGTSTTAQGIEPRADLAKVDFDAVCGGEEAAEGEKRVALLLDYGTDLGDGTPPDPRAECVVATEKASTQQLLDEVAQTRVDSGMLCGIDGYPAKGCGAPVKNAEVPTDEAPVAFAMASDGSGSGTSDAAGSDDDGGIPWAPVGVGALVVVIGAGAFAMTRKSKTA